MKINELEMFEIFQFMTNVAKNKMRKRDEG